MMVERSDVRQDELMRHLRAVSAEVRLSGSPEEARAFDYIERELKSWGYDVKRYSLDAYTGYPEQAWLKLTSPQQVEFLANGYSLSPGTSPEGIEAELVDAGNGSAAEFAAIDAATETEQQRRPVHVRLSCSVTPAARAAPRCLYSPDNLNRAAVR